MAQRQMVGKDSRADTPNALTCTERLTHTHNTTYTLTDTWTHPHTQLLPLRHTIHTMTIRVIPFTTSTVVDDGLGTVTMVTPVEDVVGTEESKRREHESNRTYVHRRGRTHAHTPHTHAPAGIAPVSCCNEGEDIKNNKKVQDNNNCLQAAALMVAPLTNYLPYMEKTCILCIATYIGTYICMYVCSYNIKCPTDATRLLRLTCVHNSHCKGEHRGGRRCSRVRGAWVHPDRVGDSAILCHVSHSQALCPWFTGVDVWLEAIAASWTTPHQSTCSASPHNTFDCHCLC